MSNKKICFPSNHEIFSPENNIKQMIKQSLLLEEHLLEPSKRCPDCICKHFFMIMALQEEALSLAGENIRKYPLLNDLLFYNTLFEFWLKNKNNNNDEIYNKIAHNLRIRRKEFVGKYILN